MTYKKSAIKMVMFALAALTLASDCAGQTYWKRTCSTPEDYCALSAISATADGHLVGAGNTYTTGSPMKMYLLKTDAFGNPVWTKTYNGTGEACANGIAAAGDGKFIVAGTTSKYGEQPYVYILKINSNGDTIWTRTIPVGGTAFAVNATPDGNFLVAGEASLSTENLLMFTFSRSPRTATRCGLKNTALATLTRAVPSRRHLKEISLLPDQPQTETGIPRFACSRSPQTAIRCGQENTAGATLMSLGQSRQMQMETLLSQGMHSRMTPDFQRPIF